jgi:WD40 repeat protein
MNDRIFSTSQSQTSLHPPAQPVYILRGHGTQVHSVAFLRQNKRLLTGDADGWVVLWSVAAKRAVAVWRAHNSAILGLGEWGSDKTITYVLFTINPRNIFLRSSARALVFSIIIIIILLLLLIIIIMHSVSLSIRTPLPYMYFAFRAVLIWP